jgi:hypothetical protein|tara:strand:- start:2073 stop:2216 length:144 start_codon:yes stop_codon:yes gene_type:complete
VEPPKIGDGVFGLSFGGLHGASSFFSTAFSAVFSSARTRTDCLFAAK